MISQLEVKPSTSKHHSLLGGLSEEAIYPASFSGSWEDTVPVSRWLNGASSVCNMLAQVTLVRESIPYDASLQARASQALF